MSVDFLRRRAGLLAPLSALRSRGDLGLGDLSCLEPVLAWMADSGLSVLQLLPVHDLDPQGACPYSGISAFALDPAVIDLGAVPEIRDSPALSGELARWRAGTQGRAIRAARRARFGEVRALKMRLLDAAFSLFTERRDPVRVREFEAFRERSAAWLGDYALFRAIKALRGWEPWRAWPEALRERDPGELEKFSGRHAELVRFFEWVQWIAHAQWLRSRLLADARGVLLFGDIPFGLNLESADVWARAAEFDLGLVMGAPPDQFSADGQSWGLPAYRWDSMERGGHAWWRARVRRAAELYDLFRLDHLVGFFRTWTIPSSGGPGRFDVAEDASARARGERFLRMVLEERGRAAVVAEDLGVIPPWVRETLSSLGIPGYKVARWERRNDGFWHPRDYPSLSVANLSNHDTSTLAGWWTEMPALERQRYWEMVVARREEPPRLTPEVQERLLGNLYEAGSALVVTPFQDAIRSRRRVNVPARVDARDWTYRVPWDAEEWGARPRPRQASLMLRRLAEATGRAAPSSKADDRA